MGVTKRHDNIVNHLVATCRRLAIPVNLEPPMPDKNGKRTRPDLSFVTPHDGTVYIDVSVVCAFAASNAAMNDSVAAREQRKRKKYAESATMSGCTFLPFALSSIGELGEGARTVIDLFVSAYHHASDSYDRSLARSITASVCVQLQTGNAMVDTAGVAALGALHRPAVVHPQLVTRRPRPLPAYVHRSLPRAPASPSHFPCYSRLTKIGGAAAPSPPVVISRGDSKREAGSPPSPYLTPIRSPLSPVRLSCSYLTSRLFFAPVFTELSSDFAEQSAGGRTRPLPLPTTSPSMASPVTTTPDAPVPIADS